MSGINRVRRVDLLSGWVESAMGTGIPTFNGDGLAVATNISEVLGMITDFNGNLYFTDSGNHRVRTLNISGKITTIAGDGSVGSPVDGASATMSALNTPAGIARSTSGDIYFSDVGIGAIFRIRNGVISKVADNPTATAITGPALQVRIPTCTGMTLNADASGLYFTEEVTDTIRYLDFNTQQVTLIAGNGT